MTVETKSLFSSGLRTKSATAGRKTVRVVDSVIDDSSFNSWKDSINYKAVAFESTATKDALTFEIQQKRAQWDPTAGQFRCPPETPAAGQFTNRLGEGCTTGFVRRLAARLGERLTSVGQGLGARRLDQGRDTELGVGAGARRTGAALEDWAQEGVDTPLMQARRARALARRGALPDGTPSGRATRRDRARQLRERMLDRASRLREVGRRVDWGWNEEQDESLRRQQGLPAGGAPLAPPIPGRATPGATTPGAPGAPAPNVPTPRPGTPGRVPPVPGRPAPRPTPSPARPATGRANYVNSLSRGQRLAWLIQNGLDPNTGIAVHSPRNQDWVDLSNEMFPGVMPSGKNLKTMTGDELDAAYNSFMAIAADRNRSDDERVIAARMAGKIAGQSRTAARKWEEFNNEWDAVMARATTQAERDLVAARREQAARELVARIGVYGSITRERRDRSQAKMPRQDANPNDWYDYINELPDAQSGQSQTPVLPQPAVRPTPTPTRPRPIDQEDQPTPEAPTEDVAPETPTPREPRQPSGEGQRPRVERERRGEEAGGTTTPSATGRERGTGGRGVRTRSRGQTTTAVGGRSVAESSIEELLDQMDRSDAQKERRKAAQRARVPFNETLIRAPQGEQTGLKFRRELGLPDPDKRYINYTAEELDDLFEKMWNIMTDPNETMVRRRMARSIARSVENANENRISDPGAEQGTRSIYPAGAFGFGYSNRDYVTPRRADVWDDFLNLPSEEFEAKHGFTNKPMPPGWRPDPDSGYATAQYLVPYLSPRPTVTADDPPPFSRGDDISLGTEEPSTELGAAVQEVIDVLDTTLEESGFSDANKQKAKEEYVKHIYDVARQQEGETGDISDGVRDAFGIARGEAEKEGLLAREIALSQSEWFDDPPILYNGNLNPAYRADAYPQDRLDRFAETRAEYVRAANQEYQTRILAGQAESDALADTVETVSGNITAKRLRAAIMRMRAAALPEGGEKNTLLVRAESLETSALAQTYATDDFIESVSRTLAPETVEQMAQEVEQRSAWNPDTDRLIEPFDENPDFHSANVAAFDGRFVGIYDAITSLSIAISRRHESQESFWREFESSLERIPSRLSGLTRPEEQASLQQFYDGLLRVTATRDVRQLISALSQASDSLFPDDMRILRDRIVQDGMGRASAFHYYRFSTMGGGSDFFRSRARLLNEEINALDGIVARTRPSKGSPPSEMDEIYNELRDNLEGWIFDERAIGDLDDEVTVLIRDSISDLRRYASYREQGDAGFSVASWIDSDYGELLSNPSATIDDLGVNPRRAEEIRADASAFLNGLIDSIGGIDTESGALDALTYIPRILGGFPGQDVDVDEAIGFLRQFDDQWFSQDLFDRLARERLDPGVARIIGGFVPPVNTGSVDIDTPDQLDTTPPTDTMRERIRNMVRSVFAQRRERQRGRYEEMYPDLVPWQDDSLDSIYEQARNGLLSAQERIVALAYTMPEFEVEIIERDNSGNTVRNADGTPKKATYLFRVDPDDIDIASGSVSGYIQAKLSSAREWENIGHFSRFLSWPNKTVSHSHMFIGSNASGYVDRRGQALGDKLKGSGFSETFNGHALRTLRRAGFEKAAVSAAADGVYVWGRSGFRDQYNRSSVATAISREVTQWNNGRPSILRSQDQADLWAYTAGRLNESQDPDDPYNHIEAILVVDDSATFDDPDERRRRSQEIKTWFTDNAGFGSGTLNIEEVYGPSQPLPQGELLSEAVRSELLQRGLLAYSDRGSSFDPVGNIGDQASGYLILNQYYGVSRGDQGRGRTPSWTTDVDADINPIIADTSTGPDNAEAYVEALIEQVGKIQGLQRPLLSSNEIQAVVNSMIGLREDRQYRLAELSQEQVNNIVSGLRTLMNPETSEASFVVKTVAELDSVLNPDANPRIERGLSSTAGFMRSLGVSSEDVLRGARAIRIRDASSSKDTALEAERNLGSLDIQVVLRPTSASEPGRPTYYATDSRVWHNATGILYPNQNINPMGFDWANGLRGDSVSLPSLYGFTRGQVQPEDITTLRMYSEMYESLRNTGRLADIPSSIRIEIIDGPDGLLAARNNDDGPDVEDAISQVEQALTDESSEPDDEVTLGDVFDGGEDFDFSRGAMDRRARQQVQEARRETEQEQVNEPETEYEFNDGYSADQRQGISEVLTDLGVSHRWQDNTLIVPTSAEQMINLVRNQNMGRFGVFPRGRRTGETGGLAIAPDYEGEQMLRVEIPRNLFNNLNDEPAWSDDAVLDSEEELLREVAEIRALSPVSSTQRVLRFDMPRRLVERLREELDNYFYQWGDFAADADRGQALSWGSRSRSARTMRNRLDTLLRENPLPNSENDSEVDTDVPETPNVSVPGVGVEEADEALEAATPPTPQTPSRPRFPRQPPAAAFEGRADELFSGTRTWQGVKKILDDNDVIFLDYETTGIQTDEYGRIVSNGLPTQIGAVRMRGGKVVDRFNVYINPGRPLNEWEQWSRDNLRDADGNPITQEFLEGQISIADAHRQLAEWSGEGAIFGMQNAIFDNEVLERSLTESGIDWRPDGILDTKEIADMTLPRWTPENPVGPTRTLPDGTVQASNSLADITRYLGVELGARHHTADYDAAATGEVLQRIVEGGIEGRWGADVLDPDKRDAKELQNQQDFNEAIERFIAANEAWRKANAPEEQPLQIETTPPVARQRRGEAGGSDVKPRVRRGAVANEGQREAAQAEKPAAEPERAATTEAPAPSTPAPKQRRATGSQSSQRAEQRTEPESPLDREVTPRVGSFRVSRQLKDPAGDPNSSSNIVWVLYDPANPNHQDDTEEFLDQQVTALRNEYSQTLNTIGSLNESLSGLLDELSSDTSLVDSPGEEEASGESSIANEADGLRSQIRRLQGNLAEIGYALTRIENGTYGLSRGYRQRPVFERQVDYASGTPMDPERLRAMPIALFSGNELIPPLMPPDGGDQDFLDSQRQRIGEAKTEIERIRNLQRVLSRQNQGMVNIRSFDDEGNVIFELERIDGRRRTVRTQRIAPFSFDEETGEFTVGESRRYTDPSSAETQTSEAPIVERAEEVGQVEQSTTPTPDVTPTGMRNREYSLSADPKPLDRPMRVPDFSNYKLPYDPSKTYAAPVGRNLSMMLDSVGMDGSSGTIQDRQQSLARAVRAAFNEPDWSDEYALGRMFNIVDEATDLDFDEAQSAQSAEMMERVQEMITNMIDEQIATAEGLERPGSRINIDMSDDDDAPTGSLTPIVRGREANRYNQLLERLRDPDGGFTFSLTEFDDVKTGWAIARKGYGIKLPASELFSDDEEKMQDAIDRLEAMTQLRRQELLERGTEEGRLIALGAWHDPDDGIVYFDVVDVYSKDRMSSEEAIAEGLNQNQLKITDLDVLQLALADDDWSRPIFLESGGNGEDVTDPVLLGRYVDLIRSDRLAGATPEAGPESGRTGSVSAPPRAKAEIIGDYGTWIEGRATVTDGPFMMGNREFPGLEADIQWSVARSPGIIDDENINAAQVTVRIPAGWVGGDEIIETAYLPRTAQRGKSLQALINKAYRKAATKWLREYRLDRERRGLENTRGLAGYDGSAAISIDEDIPDLIALSQSE